MNEWIVSAIVTIAVVGLGGLFIWVREKHLEILMWLFAIILTILMLGGIIFIVHFFIYEVFI